MFLADFHHQRKAILRDLTSFCILHFHFLARHIDKHAKEKHFESCLSVIFEFDSEKNWSAQRQDFEGFVKTEYENVKVKEAKGWLNLMFIE